MLLTLATAPLETKELLLPKAEQIVGYLEENCSSEALYEGGIFAMLYIRYQNALSALRENPQNSGRLRSALQFLISANRAYIGDHGDWEDPLRQILMEMDKLVDSYLHKEA